MMEWNRTVSLEGGLFIQTCGCGKSSVQLASYLNTMYKMVYLLLQFDALDILLETECEPLC